MRLQCPVCAMQGAAPNSLEGHAIQCPGCGAVGYAARRPGGLANLVPELFDALESQTDDVPHHVATSELAELMTVEAEPTNGPAAACAGLWDGAEAPDLAATSRTLEDLANLIDGLPPERLVETWGEAMRRPGRVDAPAQAHHAPHHHLVDHAGLADSAAPAAPADLADLADTRPNEPLTAPFLCACGYGVDAPERLRGRRAVCPQCEAIRVVGEPVLGGGVDLEAVRRAVLQARSRAAAPPEGESAPPSTEDGLSRGEVAVGATSAEDHGWSPGVDASCLQALLDNELGVVKMRSIHPGGCEIARWGLPLRAGDATRLRLLPAPGAGDDLGNFDGEAAPSRELLDGAGVLSAVVVQETRGNLRLAFTGVDQTQRRKLTALTARLAQRGNAAHIQAWAQGF